MGVTKFIRKSCNRNVPCVGKFREVMANTGKQVQTTYKRTK